MAEQRGWWQDDYRWKLRVLRGEHVPAVCILEVGTGTDFMGSVKRSLTRSEVRQLIKALEPYAELPEQVVTIGDSQVTIANEQKPSR